MMHHCIIVFLEIPENKKEDITTPDRRQSKTLKYIDERRSKIQMYIETEFSIVILSPNWRQMATENSFLAIFDPLSSILRVFSIAVYSV